MRVFISHSSQDKAQVEALAVALRERGFETWLDQWELQTGDNLVAAINQALEDAEASVVVFSAAAAESIWVTAETRYLIWAAIEENKLLVPVVIDDGAPIPPLVRPYLRRGIGEVDAIAEALRNRRAGPPPVRSAAEGKTELVVVTLRRGSEDRSIRVEVRLRGEVYADETFARLSPEVVHGRELFLRGSRRETDLADLGRALRPLCLPGDAAGVLSDLLAGSPLGTTIEIRFESDDTELLGLPFETLRLSDGQLLAVHPKVVMLRRPLGLTSAKPAKLAGPLKILVAVGAPDEDKTPNVVLDHERELQNILDAVEEARSRENVEVRILEVGSPEEIGEAIERDAYHVLHLSCHGAPGMLELETEDGAALRVSAKELLEPIQSQGRPLPLVFLNSCHGAARYGDTASLAEELLRAGVPCVLAMQTSVTDHYATLLARSFYEHLARRDAPRASRALAEARKELEKARRQAIEKGIASPAETRPEGATATLYLAGEESALLDTSLHREALRSRPVYEVSGPVPQLRIDDLIGRRKELRQALRTLRDGNRRFAGVALTGIGGVGKSAVAGRAMQRLTEEGWMIAAHHGRFDLAAIIGAIGRELLLSPRQDLQGLAGILLNPQVPEDQRFGLVVRVMAQEHLLLVLDDFEKNLPKGGGSFLDPDTATFLGFLVQNARKGRLLITCRYPVPGFEVVLDHLSLGPLSDAESRKLLLRLPALRACLPAELRKILRVIGGHPRMLELLDALMCGGEGRLAQVTTKLQSLLTQEEVEINAEVASLDEHLHQAILLGARDVMLNELLAVARAEDIQEALLQLAVSSLPVSSDGLARMMAEDPAAPEYLKPTEKALERLAALSLTFRLRDGSGWVHRWTAEGLARLSDPSAHRQRCNRAGRYRWWRGVNESHDLSDAVEALRNYLQGQDFDTAAGVVARSCFESLRRFKQSASIAALAAEVLEQLPLEHDDYGRIADEEATAHLALDWTHRAKERYEMLLALYKQRVDNEPMRESYQRDLSVIYNKMGNMYLALGQGELTLDLYHKALAIREQLSKVAPDRSAYLRDLGVSYERMGDLYIALGQGERAREMYKRSLENVECLLKSEPYQPGYRHDLALCCNKMGHLYRRLGQMDLALESFQKALGILESLSSMEYNGRGFERDLLVAYGDLGELHRILGQGERALSVFAKALAINQRLTDSEPDRADYQRDLSVTYDKIGDLYRAMNDWERAGESYQRSLEIVELLFNSESDRSDYQRDLSITYNKIGDWYHEKGEEDGARKLYLRSLRLIERLSKLDPVRSDYQVDLVVSLVKVGKSKETEGKPELERALSILERLQFEGRLSPADEPKIGVVRQALAQFEGSE